LVYVTKKDRELWIQKIKEKDDQILDGQMANLKKQVSEVKKEIEQLVTVNRELDQQIEGYRQQVREIRLMIEEQLSWKKNGISLNTLFIEEITRLIRKKLPKKAEYIELLNRIDLSYIDSFRSLYDGNLSAIYLKYCMCFAIGMDVGDVSECFSIEPSSVHMARHRLKKKFGLTNSDDLDIFLRDPGWVKDK
jgi:hypothetical protein